MALHQRYNNENILVRAIIAGLLNILNNKIVYEQVWSNEDIESIQIPWFYNMSGDERFMQDFYTHYAHCVPPKPVDGNFDMIPRGVITYTGAPIDSTRTTSRYVQGTFLKEVNGQLQTYRSFLYSIPLNVNFDCELWLDNQITGLKVEQIIREVFYKTITFYVYFKGMRVGCTVGFPEDLTLEKNIQYSFESDNRVKIKFTLQVESYQPVFDPTTEVNANNYMSGFNYRLTDMNTPKNDGNITMTTNYENTVVPKGYPLLLEWDYINENSIINKVDILWSYAGENDRNKIETSVSNNEYYAWNIPENFTAYKHPSIIWPQDGSISVYRQPVIRIIPDLSTNEISETSFNVFDVGYFLSPEADTSINIVLEMKDDNNQVYYSGDASIFLNIVDYRIDIDNPISMPEGNIAFPGTVDYKIIDIYVVNSLIGYSNTITSADDVNTFGVIRNVIVV